MPLGVFRLCLALTVFFDHAIRFGVYPWIIGKTAVYTFFVVSGFHMQLAGGVNPAKTQNGLAVATLIAAFVLLSLERRLVEPLRRRFGQERRDSRSAPQAPAPPMMP